MEWRAGWAAGSLIVDASVYGVASIFAGGDTSVPRRPSTPYNLMPQQPSSLDGNLTAELPRYPRVQFKFLNVRVRVVSVITNNLKSTVTSFYQGKMVLES